MWRVDLVELRTLEQRGLLLRALEGARHLAEDATQPADVRVEALFVACRCAAYRQLYAEAYGYAERARGMAEAAGDPQRAARARLFAGWALLEAGAPGDAEEHLLAFLEAAEKYPALREQKFRALFHLAVAYERLRRPEPAVALYQQAAELAEGTWRLKCQHNAAWLLLRLQRNEEAAAQLDLAATEMANEGWNEEKIAHRTAHLALQAVYYYQVGRIDEAMDAAEEVLTPGVPGTTEWARTCAAWVAASVALDKGRQDLANVMLKAALRYAPDCKDPALMNLVTALRGRVESLA